MLPKEGQEDQEDPQVQLHCRQEVPQNQEGPQVQQVRQVQEGQEDRAYQKEPNQDRQESLDCQ